MVNRARGDIRRLAAASAISGTGDWAASTALALAVYAKTGSAVWLSLSFLLTRIPSALVAPLSGIMADRLGRRRLLITCGLLRAGALCGLAGAHGAPARARAGGLREDRVGRLAVAELPAHAHPVSAGGPAVRNHGGPARPPPHHDHVRPARGGDLCGHGGHQRAAAADRARLAGRIAAFA